MFLFQRDSEREKKKTAAVAMRFGPRILIGWMSGDLGMGLFRLIVAVQSKRRLFTPK